MAFVAVSCIETPAVNYITWLKAQERGEGDLLSDAFIHKAQPYYQTSLREVKYFQNIETFSDLSVTIDKTIYFKNEISIENIAEIELVLHELKHVDQWQEPDFVQNYFRTSIESIMLTRARSFHQNNKLEKEAAQHGRKVRRCFEYFSWRPTCEGLDRE